MIAGSDFYGVLNKHRSAFIELAESILKDGEFYIITAVTKDHVDEVKRAVERSNVPYTDVRVVVYEKYGDIPRLKFEVASELGVQFFIDDRKDTVRYLNKRGITAVAFEV
jgi:hypothetical protein